MDKIKEFQKLLKSNRKTLKSSGFAPSTIHSWENGRFPKFERAIKLAEVLGVELDAIPYFRVIRK